MGQTLHSMWKTVKQFFSTPDLSSKAPKMDVAIDAGSRYAVTGYAEYEEGAMKFLETRIARNSQTEIVPSALSKLIGKDSISSMMDTFRLCSQIGKNIVTIATAAASQEANAYTLDYNDEEAFELAQIMTNDLLDDACGYSSTHDLDTTASMSPHRLCRYEAVSSNQTDVASAQQIFGAHTDTSFVTMIPVAAVPGLEVYDDDLDVWIRPEMIARQHWERQNNNNKEENDHNPPWHCR